MSSRFVNSRYDTRLYAHRGAAAELPENTIASFERATAYGVHGLEMDVHMSSDGIIVVAHDPDGQRMCRQSQAISRTPYAQLKQWDAGWGFLDSNHNRIHAEKGFQIPSFAEVLEHFPNHIINVDLKQSHPSMVHAVIKIVRDAKAEERVILASFSQATLLHLRLRRYRGHTCMGSLEIAAALFAPSLLVRHMPLRGSVAQIPTQHGQHLFATRKRIQRIHDAGARVDFWTINNVSEAKNLLDIGADGIMTDDPKAIAPLFTS